MTGYSILSLKDVIDQKGEEFCYEILSSFLCPANPDVEKFLTNRSAVEFAKQGIAQTFLVYASFKKEPVLCGYFTIASKYITVPRRSVSKSVGKRLARFAQSSTKDAYILAAPLLAQLGKNFVNNYNELITGDELLKFALDKIGEAQAIIGGRFLYVECEDKPKLINFYEDNGFVAFGKRSLDKEEEADMSGKYLIQLWKYLK